MLRGKEQQNVSWWFWPIVLLDLIRLNSSKVLTVLTPGIWKMEFLNGNYSYWTSLRSFGWKEVSFQKPIHSRHSFNWLKNEVLNSLLNRKSTVVLIHIFWNIFLKKILSSPFLCGNKYDSIWKKVIVPYV